jgi:hypothetical protein
LRNVTMKGFDHILKWKLKAGSHVFPGKDGGTCINEAALVAAGFEYRPITRVEDMPACFSRPICRLAMRLNDQAGEVERQRLLPFVTRLACADTPEVERKRQAYIALHTKRALTFLKGLEVLEGALAIGRQADALALDDVRSRMGEVTGRMGDAKTSLTAVQPTAPKPVSLANTGLLSKLKSWSGASKKPEPVG